MDKIKERIRQILKKEFEITEVKDDDTLFHYLDSISYFRYILSIEKEFQINVEKNIFLRTIDETANYIKK